MTDDIPNTPEQRALIAKHNADIKIKYPNLVEVSTVTHPTPPLTGGKVNKGGQNSFPSQITTRPPPPSPIR
jgi:hypothetical protein